MKAKIFLTIFIPLLFFSCSDDDNVSTTTENLKEEALEFSLKVVNCYFTQDTTVYKSCLPDMLYLIDPEEPPFETSLLIIPHVLASYNYSEYSLDEYKETYDYQIFDYETYSKEVGQWMAALTYWHPTKDDYLFIGYIPVEGKEPFMNSQDLFFFVTKSSGEWKLKATY
jgi:hypothetical protein